MWKESKVTPNKPHTFWQVCSLFLQVNPTKFDQITNTLLSIENTEIPASDKNTGKIIVVMSSDDQQQLLTNIEKSKEINGVLSVSLVYHQQDDEPLL